jgi:hypothetical protein
VLLVEGLILPAPAARREGRREQGSRIGHETIVIFARHLRAMGEAPLTRRVRLQLVGAASLGVAPASSTPRTLAPNGDALVQATSRAGDVAIQGRLALTVCPPVQLCRGAPRRGLSRTATDAGGVLLPTARERRLAGERPALGRGLRTVTSLRSLRQWHLRPGVPEFVVERAGD